MLITPSGHDLNGYLFLDGEHAREWLSQRYVVGAGYRVKFTPVVRKICECGRKITKAVKAASKRGSMSSDEFLRWRADLWEE